MKLVANLVLVVVMAVGAWAIVNSSLKERQANAAEDARAERCQQAIDTILRESDEVMKAKQFPSREQQDYWREITRGCEE